MGCSTLWLPQQHLRAFRRRRRRCCRRRRRCLHCSLDRCLPRRRRQQRRAMAPPSGKVLSEEEHGKAKAAFQGLGVCEQLAEAAASLGWKSPSSIQEQAVPLVLQGEAGRGLRVCRGRWSRRAVALLLHATSAQQRLLSAPCPSPQTRTSLAWRRRAAARRAPLRCPSCRRAAAAAAALLGPRCMLRAAALQVWEACGATLSHLSMPRPRHPHPPCRRRCWTSRRRCLRWC